jgi:hypothetical protein
VVAGAAVTVRNAGTGIERATKTDASGDYSVPSLQPGQYSVTVQASGFARFQLRRLALQVDQNVTANAQLGIASEGQTVTVDSAAPIIDAQTITVGQVIDQRTVQKIPLNGRHFLDLTFLVPGTTVPPVTGSLTVPLRGKTP